MDKHSLDDSTGSIGNILSQPVHTSTAKKQPDKHQQLQRVTLSQHGRILNEQESESESVSPQSLSPCDLKYLKDQSYVSRGNRERMCCSCK